MQQVYIKPLTNLLKIWTKILRKCYPANISRQNQCSHNIYNIYVKITIGVLDYYVLYV